MNRYRSPWLWVIAFVGLIAGQGLAQGRPDKSIESGSVRDIGGPQPAWRTASYPDQSVAAESAVSAQEAPTPDLEQGTTLEPTAPASRPEASPAAPKPVVNPYKGVFYENDFSYLANPNNTEHHLGDFFKRRQVTPNFWFDAGGEYRLRQHNEHILFRDNNFLLQRTRLYTDLHFGQTLRFYGEAIDATSSWEDRAPRPIEENRFDALNLFGDGRLWDGGKGELWLRGGRQELLYGAQRLISPLDWSNTRRTFDGAKLFWRGESWNTDFFWTRPVPFNQHVNNDHNFDHSESSQEFLGLYATRKDLKNLKIDLYYLRYAGYDETPDFAYNTFGTRWEGSGESWLYEFEGGYQCGEFGPDAHSAGFYTLGVGRKLKRFAWNPILWVYYDWASGDADPLSGKHETFNQLFPLGHRYFGFMDIVGRQNIEDWNCLLTLTPNPKTEFLVWFHVFHLQQARDALYDAAGAPIRQDLTGAAGRDVGQELDLIYRWTFSQRTEILFGYSHLFPGRFLLDTGGAPGRDFYYTQFTARF